MGRGRLSQFKESGSALVLVLIVTFLLLVAGVGMLQCGLQARVFAARASNQIAAQVAADAGLERAIVDINAKLKVISTTDPQDISPTLSKPGDVPLPNSNTSYTYKVVANSIFSNKDITIESTGKSGAIEKTVYAILKLKGLFDIALLSKDRISLMPNTLITGYNSDDPTDTDIDVKIGTTSTEPDRIPLGPGTVVEGDVFVGLGGDPAEVIGAGGTITGEKFALTEPIELPVITAPALPDFGTVISVEGSTVTLGPDDSGTYQEIQLSGSPGVLEIDGGDVVLHLTGNINLGNDTDIIVRANSSLILYAGGDITMGNSAGFLNENVSPKALKIFGTSMGLQLFVLKAKSSIFGVVYAPNANIELYPKAELYGAISANDISIKSGGAFYYDEALRDVSPDDEGARFVIETWWE